MASVASLGLHKPAALPLLVAEGVLPAEPAENAFTWQTVEGDRDHDGEQEAQEELVTTEHCVVWSRGGIVQRLFRFDVEGEPVTHAAFTRFPSQNAIAPGQGRFVADSEDAGTGKANASLSVPKQRTSKSNGRSQSDVKATSTATRPYKDDIARKGDEQHQSTGSRALVVLLKSHAHIFFLSGTSHIVHLPFEVEAIFSTVYGVLLQRKLSDNVNIPPTPLIPSAPNNSFSYSQGFSSSSPPNSQPLGQINSAIDEDSPIHSLLRDLLKRSSLTPDVRLPRVFCLTDPLAEIGTVAVGTGSDLNRVRKQISHGKNIFENLGSKENVLFVSPKDELPQNDHISNEQDSLIFVVTQNEESGYISVWTAIYAGHGSDNAIWRQRTTNARGTTSRRSSSFAPNFGTGATTPTVRGAPSMRESFGGARSRRHVSSDPTFDDGSTREEDLLDSAFANPSLPAKSTRRVSGLLARADLSTTHDRTAFSDLAGVHAGNKPGRKGASFGAHGTRQSAGPDTGANVTRPHVIHGMRASLDSVSLHEPQLDDIADELDDIHSMRNFDGPKPDAGLKGLQKEIILSKIYTVPVEGRRQQVPVGRRNNPTHKIMTIRTPTPSLGDALEHPLIVMYLFDRSVRELMTLQIEVKATRKPTQSQSAAKRVPCLGLSPRVTGMSRSAGIIDACKVSDGNCNRLLVLEQSNDGMGSLSLQAPWSLSSIINLPSNLHLHHPYQITSDISLRQKREGGFKRILSQGPQALIALEHSSCPAQVDVVDSHNDRHRLQIQLRPQDARVTKVISVLESILPSSAGDGESILRGWWEVMSWIRARPEAEMDLEWTAIVVLIFSMGVAFIGEKRSKTTTRQKKKKGGLLRSSSGATTDLDSWEAMMVQEAGSSGVSPPWMQTEAWRWILKETGLPSRSEKPQSSNSFSPSSISAVPLPKKSAYLINCASLAREFIASSGGQIANGAHGYLPTASSRDSDVRRTALASMLLGLHLLREEQMLDVLASSFVHQLTPVLTQLGTWLGWESWGKSGQYMLENEGMEAWLFEDSVISGLDIPAEPFPPPSILQFVESTNLTRNPTPMISLLDVASSPEAGSGISEMSASMLRALTPRTMALAKLLTSDAEKKPESLVTGMLSSGLTLSSLETLPESSAAPFRAAITSCQANPSTVWETAILEMIDRGDVALLEQDNDTRRSHAKFHSGLSSEATRDVHSICHSVLDVETVGPYDGSAELDRQSITRLLFKEDQRFAEAAKLVHPLHHPTAICTPEPDWTDTNLLEAQQDLAKVIAARTLSVSPGRGLLFYSARLPLLTEKFPVHGFTLSCVMKPADTTVTADRTQFTEDKVSWAFFHAGVEAGLSISKDAKGIDTSWILFNKPKELTNRHAGFLLALGFNGHLKSIAKWVAFKYLTPKHTMTSIGLLLGLSASYLGTMDTLVTRLLSVHVTRMLPPGAAELNLSPLTQTSGIMGIGLLYCRTQHRRMSEIMLSEMENTDQDDLANPMENLRDEGYRLAAGFALGYINLGQGKDLKGLHDMHIIERLLVLAVGIRKVSIVHILDKAAPAATIATSLIFMKTQDEALARKIDVPDTVHQFDYVRPDLFLLRTMARHLIMWDNIQANSHWMSLQLPLAYQHKSTLTTVRTLTSEDMAFFNIVAGLCLSIGLKFAGSGSSDVRNLLCHYLDQFIRICKLPSLSYDGKLARITARNCQDVVALATSCVMAGTGDLHILRRLRSLHGRTDRDTPFGSHMATHLAIGILFIGGGTHTFGTSNIAVASLLCSFYPLFPDTVLDNKSHLQAFRHFWVLAAERRCLIARDVDTYRPISLAILVLLRDGVVLSMTTPCLLPELHTISQVKTNDAEYWSVTLDLAENPSHQAAFARHQSIYVRRRAAYDAYASVFSATMQALNDAESAHQLTTQAFRWIFTLPSFSGLNRAEQALLLPAEASSAIYKGTRTTVIDDWLVLEKACLESGRAERLWNLRILFAWADKLNRRGEESGWLGKEVVERLRAGLAMRRWRIKEG